MNIHIFTLLSKRYIQKKSANDSVQKFIQNFKNLILFSAQESFKMNNIKVKVYEKVLRETCEEHKGAEDFIKKELDEFCSHEKLSAQEIIYFLVSFLQFMFPC